MLGREHVITQNTLARKARNLADSNKIVNNLSQLLRRLLLPDVVEIHSRLAQYQSYMSRGILKPLGATFASAAPTKLGESLYDIEKTPLLHVT